MELKTYQIVDSVDALHEAIARVRAAQKVFATYTQEQVDKIFLAAASAADKARISLAKLAVEETGMGIVEDKVIKNHYAAEYIYNAYKETKTCGVIEEDKAFGIRAWPTPIPSADDWPWSDTALERICAFTTQTSWPPAESWPTSSSTAPWISST